MVNQTDSILGNCECAIINRDMHIPLLYADFDSFKYIPRSGIAGSYGISNFRFLGEELY
jgi:hypothetical protein